MEIELTALKCKRCGYEWMPRKQNVRQCPKCKTTYWNKERKRERYDKAKTQERSA